MNWLLRPIHLCVLWISLWACSPKKNSEAPELESRSLPVLSPKVWNGQDSVVKVIRNFTLINQDSQTVQGDQLRGKIYVADFFFTSCPSICPIMTGHLLKVQKAFEKEPRVTLVSFSIDPEQDSPAILRAYARDHSIDTRKWWLLTGPRDSIYSLCTEDYMAFARADKNAPGGYLHSGFLILVDPEGRIRGAYDGTTEAKVEDLIRDIQKLLNEFFHENQ